jgi:hypothetical protein
VLAHISNGMYGTIIIDPAEPLPSKDPAKPGQYFGDLKKWNQ